MHVSPAIAAAAARIAERASDVRMVFTPGAQPAFDDVGRAQASYAALDPLSVAPPDRTYFATLDAGGRVRYTRNGSFAIRDGALVSAGGDAVLGYADGARLRPLRVDALDLALGRVRNARVDARGELLYDRVVLDPRNGAGERQRVVAGRLALAQFPAGTALGAGDAFSAPSGIAPRYGAAGEGTFERLGVMRRQSSGVSADASLARLDLAYRELDALEAAYSARSAAEKTAMDVLK